jgi:hypothetical protein
MEQAIDTGRRLWFVRKVDNGYDDGITIFYSKHSAMECAARWNVADNDRGIYYSVWEASAIA